MTKAPAQRLTGREFWLVFGGALLIACAMFWPLPVHLSRDIAKDPGDPLLQAWQIAWDGHAVLTQPFHLWDANLFFPNHDALAFSDCLLGYAPFGFFGGGVKGALLAYNLLFLLVYAMSVAGPYALARELGITRAPSVLVGLAFAYAPWRFEESGHLHIISSGTIALALALWLRGYRDRSWKAIVGGWAVCAWQVLIGVSLGLMLLYLLLLLILFFGGWWLRAGRPSLGVGVWRATAAGAVLLALALVVVAPAYLRVKDHHPEAKRTLAEVHAYSPPPAAFFSTSEHNPVWGKATKSMRDKLPAVAEETLFPGLTILALAIIGLIAAPCFSKRMKIGLFVAGLLAAIFSCGLGPLHGDLTYKPLFEYAPGWDGVRTPTRFNTLTSLVLALLAGGGAMRVAAAVRGRIAQRQVLAGTAVVALLGAGVLAEGSSFAFSFSGPDKFEGSPHPTPPAYPPGLQHVPGPYVEFPSQGPNVYGYMLWSVRGFPQIASGISGFQPTLTTNILNAADPFPSRSAIKTLRSYGFRSVVVTPGDGHALKRPPRDVRRYKVGQLTVFDLSPGRASARGG